MLFTRDQAVEAAEEFLSGVARWTGLFFDDGTAKRILRLEGPSTDLMYLEDSTNKKYEDPVDFSRFEFPNQIGELYDFVVFGVARDLGHIEEVVSDVLFPFDSIFGHRGSFLAERTGQDLLDVRVNGLPITKMLADVMYAAMARIYISGGFGPGENAINLDWLAALAGVTTKTVRNAATNPGPNQLKTSKIGGKLVVMPEDALAWLRTRPSFHETKFGEVAPQQVESYDDIRQLALHVHALTKSQNLEIQNVASDLQWSDTVADAFQSLLSVASDPSLALSVKTAALVPRVLSDFGQAANLPDSFHFAVEASKTLAAHDAAQRAISDLTSTKENNNDY